MCTHTHTHTHTQKFSTTEWCAVKTKSSLSSSKLQSPLLKSSGQSGF